MSCTDHAGGACLCHTAHECQSIHDLYTAQRDALREIQRLCCERQNSRALRIHAVAQAAIEGRYAEYAAEQHSAADTSEKAR